MQNFKPGESAATFPRWPQTTSRIPPKNLSPELEQLAARACYGYPRLRAPAGLLAGDAGPKPKAASAVISYPSQTTNDSCDKPLKIQGHERPMQEHFTQKYTHTHASRRSGQFHLHDQPKTAVWAQRQHSGAPMYNQVCVEGVFASMRLHFALRWLGLL